MNPLLNILWITVFSATNLFQKNPLIEWKEGSRLTWDDFKRRPDPNSPNAALTGSSIKFNFHYSDNNLQYHIQCLFDKSSSWGRVKTDYILSHEQGHFDITEIYARKLNKALKEYVVKDPDNLSKDLNRIYQTEMKELNEFQNKYDKETNFSINKDKQAEWLVKIRNELKGLEGFAEYR
ncbi:MAG: DUF922 domain-containing protein [Bacteroidetes bacterium]|nr:DUF922 domain-containing protein [Bacteroidota bacterium]